MEELNTNNLHETHPFIIFPEDEDVCNLINESFPSRKRAYT